MNELEKNKAELEKHRAEIEKHAKAYGLDFFEVRFEPVDFDTMNVIAARGGFPNRYPHWRFGMEYYHLQKGYTYGLQKIYEMVINNDPCYAYLLSCNALVDQKIVMAHVYAHCDFFKNNLYFSKTNRKMMDEIANHGAMVKQYTAKYGEEAVENFLDICLSLDNLIDIHSPFIVRREEDKYVKKEIDKEEKTIEPMRLQPKDGHKEYMQDFINPPKALEDEKKRLEEKEKNKPPIKIPKEPTQDILLFLIENAPLPDWQRDILSIVREEAYYFTPQGQTKIMNEGWASYWHSKIMTQKALTNAEIIDYADHHSGTLGTSPGRINPYKLGIELFRDIEERWNKGKFGKEYEECDDFKTKKDWDKKLGLGLEKIFEVRRVHNDVSFLDAFLTREFCEEQKLFTYEYDKDSNYYELASREFEAVKQKILFSLTNRGQPVIFVADANYGNKGELLLAHKHSGVDLKGDYAKDTLVNLHKIWKRPVHLLTRFAEKGDDNILMSYDGKEHTAKKFEGCTGECGDKCSGKCKH